MSSDTSGSLYVFNDLFKIFKIADEQLDETIHNLTSCNLNTILCVLKLKWNRIFLGESDKVVIPVDQVFQLFYLETEFVKELCEIFTNLLLISKNLEEVASTLVNIINSEVTTENCQHFRVANILNSLIETIILKNELANLIIRNKDVDSFLLKHLGGLTNHNRKYISNNTRTFIISALLPNYLQIIDETHLVLLLENLFILSKESLRLDVFCQILTKNSTEIGNTINNQFLILNKDEFYTFLSNALTGQTFLQKEAIFVLQTLVNHNWNLVYLATNNSNPKTSWTAFFTLMEAGKEKQLHLIKPSIFLFNDIKSLHNIWWSPIFGLFLDHSQTLVVYTVAKYILLDWPMDLPSVPTEASKLQMKAFTKLLMRAVNRNEHSNLTSAFFTELNKKCKELHCDYYSVILSEISHHNWSPTALWNVVKSILINTSHIISDDNFNNIFHTVVHLPHVYIRRGCLKLLIDYYQDICFNNFDALIKLLKLLKTNDLLLYAHSMQKMTEDQKELLLNGIFSKISTASNIEELLCLLRITKDMNKCSESLITHTFNFMREDKKLYLYLDFPEYFGDKEHQVITYAEQYFTAYLNDKIAKDYYILLNNIVDIKKEMPLFVKKCFERQDGCSKSQIHVAMAVSAKFPDLIHDTVASWRNNCENYPDWVEVVLYRVYFTSILPKNMNRDSRAFITCFLDKGEEQEKIAFKLISDLLHSRQYNDEKENDELRKYLKRFIRHMPKLKSNKYFKDIITNFIRSAYYFFSQENVKKKDIIFDFCNETLKDMCLASPFIGMIWVENIKLFASRTPFPEQAHSKLIPLIINFWLHGSCCKKEDRIEYAICQEVYAVLKNIASDNPNEINSSIRMNALETLFIIASNKESDPFYTIVMELFDSYKPQRYFPDSEAHTQRLRTFQAILAMFHFKQSYNVEHFEFAKKLLEILVTDAHQNDVRQIIQWIILIISENVSLSLKHSLGEHLQFLIKSRIVENPSSVSSLILVLYHMTLRSKEDSFWTASTQILLPITMGAAFKTRVQAQIALKRLISRAVEMGNILEYEKFKIIEEAISSSINSSSNAFYETLKTDTVLYTSFNFISDYSFESIFFLIPKLNRTFPHEWECSLDHKFTDSSSINIHNATLTFKNAVDKFLQASLPGTRKLEPILDHSNFQLKINPWKTNILNLPSEITEGFILVASLINNAQNLGGLLRTCEVYGIKQVVLHDMHIVQNDLLKFLSVGSERWVNIIEVKSHQLEDYLKSMKKDHFTIVGAEQTRDSTKLSEYNFEKNTVLVLGNEREGISPELISLMDVCVEIPQLGQIRSLNVHVAGAICIWEYMKQRRF